jgi:signal transduction histidine kinase
MPAARRTTIRAKLVATSTLLLVVVVALFTAAQAIQQRRAYHASAAWLEATLRERLRTAGLAQLGLLSEVTKLALVQSDFITLQAIVRNTAKAEPTVLVAGVVAQHGAVLAHSDPAQVGRPATGLLREGLGARARIERYGVELAGGQRALALVAPLERRGELLGAVLLAYSLTPLENELARAAAAGREEFRSSLAIGLFVGLLGFAVGVGLTIWQSVRLSRPIVALSRQVEKMAEGDLGARVEVTATDELGQLGARFNHMAEQLRALMREAIAKATMEKELEVAEAGKLAAVGRLSAGVAHEVNNPLTYVKGNLQFLEHELAGQDEELLQLAREALHGVDRIQAVIRQLSEFSQSSRIELPARVATAIDSAAKMAMVQLRDRARLVVEVADDLPQVAIDEGKLAQVILNLLVNAAHAIPPGNVEGNNVRVSAEPLGGEVMVVVEDSGAGIPEAVLPHIFDSFFTTKEVGQGYGLGLSISRALLSAAGGTIAAENRTEGGARFTIVLPPAPSEPRRAEPTARGSRSWGGDRRRLLLVDDEPAVLAALSRTLSPAFQVTTASSLETARELLFSEDGFDVVLCDVMMPEGSGLDLVQAVERSRPELLERLVLITAGAPGRELTGVPVPVLGKPFGLDDLLRLIEDERPAIRSSTGAAGPGPG